MVLMLLGRSWLGKEDLTLEPALRGELTGILNWALDGLQRLTVTNNNVFTRLLSAEDAIITMRDLASPVGAFIREQCVIEAGLEIRCEDIYRAYKQWAEDNGHSRKTSQTFGRDLRAVVPAISVRRLGERGDRHRFYVGVDIRNKASP